MVARIKSPQTWYDYTYGYPDGYVEGDIDLTNIVFYVGKGTKGRIDDHEAEARRGCECMKCHTIRKIWSRGYPVKKRIVFETLSEEEALIEEEGLLKKYAGRFLTNVTMPNLGTAMQVQQEHAVRYVTAIEAAQRIGVAEKTVRLWVKEGKIHAHHPAPNRLAIAEEDVERLARERRMYYTSKPDHAPETSQINTLLARLAEMERKQILLEQRISLLEKGTI